MIITEPSGKDIILSTCWKNEEVKKLKNLIEKVIKFK
jgi:hypothetical protein